jgi:DNA polymerase III epsilon subunit-like protein
MTHLLFFDVETTGVSKERDRVVQIAWILANSQGESLEEKSYILKPENFYIPPAATNIHGISQEIALKKGVARGAVFREYVEAAASSSGIVAHNIDFDVGFIQAECRLLGLPISFEESRNSAPCGHLQHFAKYPTATAAMVTNGQS